MTEEKDINVTSSTANQPEQHSSAGQASAGGRHGGSRGSRSDHRSGRPRKGRGRRRDGEVQDEFDTTIIDLARVTRVMAGGKRMRFRACVLVGDKNGRIGMGVKKGADVQFAVAKATEYAKKHVFRVPIVNGSIPHRVELKHKGALVLLKPAKPGIGIIAGGPIRIVMQLAGIKNVVSKMKGSNNKINNVQAVLDALRQLQTKEQLDTMKGQE